MMLTLLLDLDDTLLNTNLDAFIPAYFKSLAGQLASQVSPETLLPALIAGTRLMNESDDPSRTLQEVFEDYFYLQIGIPKEKLKETIEYYYDVIFPGLAQLTSPRQEAKPFIDWAFSQGHRIAIATDPLLPRKATHHRLRWAGFDPDQFELVSSFEGYHFSKTHPAYFAEVLGRLGWPDGPVLMVGNDMERDILPARRLGLATYHVDNGSASGEPGPDAGVHGPLMELRPWLESTEPSSLMPAYKSVDSVIGVLAATPAVLSGLTSDLDPSSWLHKSNPGDWAMTEIICHLRDAEREIHQLQIKLLKERAEPFLPRPDASVWASQRKYSSEDGVAALRDFTVARLETLALLRSAGAEDWSRRARHAIFGPTDFLEVVGFMAEHDRLHIQQAWTDLDRLSH
jgi:FMN phosphatase YigB (HAD superfamily)